MSALLPWIAVIVTVLAGWALIKRYQTHMVLLFAGLVILICVALMGGTGFLPKGVKPSGFWLFDIFATLKSIATKQFRDWVSHHDRGRFCRLHGQNRRGKGAR